jgi:eukaryotic-like serine/threonine-protein kinase
MFEMATLQFPYVLPSDPNGLQRMHLFDTPRTSRSLRPDLSPVLDQLLMKMMAKRPNDRFKDWDEVRRGIEKAFGSGGSATPGSDVHAILAAATSAHHASVAAAAAEQRKKDEQARRRDTHQFQREALLQKFRPLVTEFNEHSQLDQARLQENGDRVVFSFPHVSIEVHFFDFGERTIPMDTGDTRRIHFLARVQNDNRQGFNAVLVHTAPDDVYGEWQGWEIGIWALARKPVDGRTHGERFGFNDEEFYDHFRFSNGATHVYTYRRLPDVVARFAELAKESRR